MDRRWIGALVLIVALAGSVVVPAVVDGRRVAGQGRPVVFPERPVVGSCLTGAGGGSGGGATTQVLPLDEATMGPCVGEVRGQVVAVLDDPPDDAVGSRRDPCFRAAAGTAGLEYAGRRPTLPEAPRTAGAGWAPFLGFTVTRVVPGDEATRGGQRWVACVARPAGGGTYQGLLDGAYTAGHTLPAAFATCWSLGRAAADGAPAVDLDRGATVLPCDRPHPAELLAVARVGDRSTTSREQMQAGCVAMAGVMMRVGDPTRAGALAVVLDPVSSDGASRPTDPWTLNCFVVATGGRELIDTVVGLGDRPLPLAG